MKEKLFGEQIIKIAEKIVATIKSQVDIHRVTNDTRYLKQLRDECFKSAIIQNMASENMVTDRLIVLAYFDVSPELTPHLEPDEENIGVVMSFPNNEKDEFNYYQPIFIRDFNRDNQYMKWFYEPAIKGKGVWSDVYFDAYVNMNVITYSVPVYIKETFLGVVGLDLDYNKFRKLMNEQLAYNIENNIASIKKQYELIGRGQEFSGQYISTDKLEFVSKDDIFDGVITRSEAMKPVMELAVKAAISSANVLLLGETGVGKNFIASYIHSKSDRRNGQLVSVNCSAIPENLIESELFGYEKGAFTGAKSEGKLGFFEAADGGTLLLDEIGEIPFYIQVKLLNVIQNKIVTRVGSTVPKKIDFRLLAATNRNLLELVKQGKFREDLYYRLNVIPIYIPPLRQRKDDIVSLLNYYLHKNMNKYKLPRKVSPELVEAFINYHWPGNIRELENLVEQLVVTSNGVTINVSALPEHIINYKNAKNFNSNSVEKKSLKRMIQEYEASIIKRMYKELGSSYKVAEALNISQSQAYYKIKRYIKES